MPRDDKPAEGLPLAALASGLLIGGLLLLVVLLQGGDDRAPRETEGASEVAPEHASGDAEGQVGGDRARRLTERSPRLEKPRIAPGGRPGVFRLVFIARGQTERPRPSAVTDEDLPPRLRVLTIAGLAAPADVVTGAAAACEWTLEDVAPGPLHVELRDASGRPLDRIHLVGSESTEAGLAAHLERAPEADFRIRTIDALGGGRFTVNLHGRMPSGGWRIPGRSVRRTAQGYESLVQLAPPENPADAVMTPMEIPVELPRVRTGHQILTLFTHVLPRGAEASERIVLNDAIWARPGLRARSFLLEGLDG